MIIQPTRAYYNVQTKFQDRGAYRFRNTASSIGVGTRGAEGAIAPPIFLVNQYSYSDNYCVRVKGAVQNQNLAIANWPPRYG